MPARRADAKRKRGSSPPTDSLDSLQLSRTSSAGASRASRAVESDQPVELVGCEGHWATTLRKARDDGHFLDCTLVVSGGVEIRAHKAVLISHSPFLHGLFTSGLAESQRDRIELNTIDGRAVEAIVDCFYCGKVALTATSVCAVIRTAHELQVDAVELAAIQYFVDRLEPSSAVAALAGGFASEFVASARGLELQRKCLEYVQVRFGECVAEPTFAEQLDVPTLAQLLEGESIAVPEQDVLAAVRAWVQHDPATRRLALQQLLPCVRIPTLPDEVQVAFFSDPLFLSLMQQSPAVAGQIAKECSTAFARTVEAVTCPRCDFRPGYLRARGPVKARGPSRFESTCRPEWEFDGSPDAIDVTPSRRLSLHGLTVGEREGDENFKAIVKVYEHETGHCLRDDSTEIEYGAPVDGWCDLVFDPPITLHPRRYQLVVTCTPPSGDHSPARRGEEGFQAVDCNNGLTLLFTASSRDENNTDLDGGQIAHLLYDLL